MDEASITQYITDTFDGIDFVIASGDTFFFYNPGGDLPPDHMFPFATLVTSDINDNHSNLNRPSVFRLNIGVSKSTFRSLFRLPQSSPDAGADADTSHDFTVLDQLLPHPVYGGMYWLCVLNPSDTTFESVHPLLAQAYEMAVSKRRKHGPANES